jgi:hypothetical protein
VTPPTPVPNQTLAALIAPTERKEMRRQGLGNATTQLADAELLRSQQQKTRFLPRNYNLGIEDAYQNTLSEGNFR